MFVDRVYARFFRSLNYDYLRRTKDGFIPDPWDETPDGPYPFVRVPLEPNVTAIVGANEAGKSQVLHAISAALTGGGIDRKDFCRYSEFFARVGYELPEFGVRFREIGAPQLEAAREMCDGEVPAAATQAALFRVNHTPKLRLYLLGAEGEWTMHRVERSTGLRRFGVPDVFAIDAGVPLPDQVPLDFLATGALKAGDDPGARRGLVENLLSRAAELLGSEDAIRTNAAAIRAAVEAPRLDAADEAKYRLAASLLSDVAGVSRGEFAELRRAVQESITGYDGGIVDTINAKLATRMNLPGWWSQDDRFELKVELRDRTLAFVIRDRTGRTYSFDERSEGLKYFLSYYVQFLSHRPPDDGQQELLIMDEPDTYLSASGQQDLLKIFDAFAHPADGQVRPVQVAYVTHSPFLIDKNHAERVRVLEKGEHDEGTRVVANASKNHYEPLRSAFGAFVGETTFIGTCNLVVEGPADQILLAGMSSWLAKRGAPSSHRLDLNSLTIVPASGTGEVPYVVFLATGRDVERPAVIVLLDGDGAGDKARRDLRSGGPREGGLVADDLVLQLSDLGKAALALDNPAPTMAIEDLVPHALLIDAGRRYADEFMAGVDLSGFRPTADAFYDGQADSHALLEAALSEHLRQPDLSLNKIGLARATVAAAISWEGDAEVTASLDANFRAVFDVLRRKQRLAEYRRDTERVSSRINRIKRSFLARHQHGARREDVLALIEEIESQLDSSIEADEVRVAMRSWVRDYELDVQPGEPVEDFGAFRHALAAVAYAGLRRVQTGDASAGQ